MFQSLKQKIYNLLRWSEKYTKTDMVYLARGGFWLTLGQIIASSSSFIIIILFANFLSVEIYGFYKYILSIVGVLSLTTLNGMDIAMVQAVARGYDGSLIPSIKLKLKYGLLGTTIGLGFTIYYYLNNDLRLALCFLIVAIFIPIMEAPNIYSSYLIGKKQFKLATNYINLSRIIVLAFSIFIILITKNLFFIVLSYFLLWSLFRYIFLKKTLKKFKPNISIDKVTIKYGKHLTLVNIIPIISAYLDRILIFNGLGVFELAVYSVVVAPLEQIKGFLKVFNTLAIPKMSVVEGSKVKKVILHKIGIIIIFLVLIILFYILACPLIFKLLFSQYQDFYYYSSIYSLSLLAYGPLLILNSFLQSKQKTKEIYKSNLLASFFQIILIILFFYFWGILGIIISKIVSNVISLIYTYALVKSYKPVIADKINSFGK